MFKMILLVIAMVGGYVVWV